MRRSTLQKMYQEQEMEWQETERRHLVMLQRLESNYQVAFGRLGTDYQNALDKLGGAHRTLLDRLTAKHEENTAQILARHKAQSEELESNLSDRSTRDVAASSTTSTSTQSAAVRKRERAGSGSPESQTRDKKRERSSPVAEPSERGTKPSRSDPSRENAASADDGPNDPTASPRSELDHATAKHVLVKTDDSGSARKDASESTKAADHNQEERPIVQNDQPLSHSIIRDRLMKHQYGSLEEFERDVMSVVRGMSAER